MSDEVDRLQDRLSGHCYALRLENLWGQRAWRVAELERLVTGAEAELLDLLAKKQESESDEK